MASFATSLSDSSLFIEKSYINGEWTESSSGSTFQVSNPADEASLGCAPESSVEDLQRAIQAASAAFGSWRALSGRQRGRILAKVFNLLVENKEDIGKIILAENGKAKGDAEGEVLFAASFFEWFSEEAS